MSTRLFQGCNALQHVSDVLLHFDRQKPKVTNHCNNNNDDDDDDSVKKILDNFTNSIYPLLKPLVLTKEHNTM